jgi:hypothetical protein
MHLHFWKFRQRHNYFQSGSNPLNVYQVIEFYCFKSASAEAKEMIEIDAHSKDHIADGASAETQVTVRRMVSLLPSPKSL